MECGSCAAALTEGARFCAACGAACTAPSPAIEERRVVTAVFCDLVGSTALSGRLDSESLRAVLLRYFDAMRAPIEAHGGTVEKFIGDAVMALFGVPTAHEDDARRALAAALGMLAAVRDLNGQLEAAFGVRIDVRIGIDTGEVVTVPGRLADQSLASGEALNVAARLEQNAAAGQILIGPDTLRAAGGAAVTEPAGLFALKGKAEPVAAHRLLGLRTREREFPRDFDTPFVGREGELARLDLLLGQAAASRSAHLVTVHGDAGIGKTRLVQQWLSWAAPSVLIGSGRCRPYGEHGTLAALGDALAQLLQGAPYPQEAADALATLRTGLLKDGTPNPSAADTCAAAARVVAAIARRRTVVLVLDDCHWATPALFELIGRLAGELAGAPVLFACLGRPEFPNGRPVCGALPQAACLPLGRLTAPQAALLAAGLAEVCAHDAGQGARVLERAEGNPLHLEQLIASLGQDGGRDEVPPTVQALLAARIGALRQEHRAVLQLAAVVGREFTARDLLLLAGRAQAPEHEQALRELVRRRLIETARGPAPCYRFSSALIQEVTYRSTAKRVRARCHERMARHCGETGESPAIVAGHWECAYRCRADLGPLDGQGEALRRRAARQLAEAAALALARSDPAWAGDLAERALALARATDPDWADAAAPAAEARLALGRGAEGRALLAQVLAAGHGLTATHARLTLATTDPEPRPGALSRAAHEALAVFTRAGDSLGIARASIRIAQEQQLQGRHAEAERLLDRALAHATRAQAEPERAMALGALGVSLCWGPAPADAAIDRCRALLAEHRGRRAAQVTLNCPLAVLLALRGDPDAARRCLAAAAGIARSLGYAEAGVFIPLFASLTETYAGNGPRAEALLRQALESAGAIGATTMTGAIRRDLARTLMERGAGDEALSLLEGDPGDLPPSDAAGARGTAARLAAARGEHAAALDLSNAALAAARRTDSPLVLATAELDAAHVHRAAGRGRDAAAAAERGAALFRRKQHTVGERWALALAARGAR